MKKKILTNYVLAIKKYHKIFRLPLTGLLWEQVLENIFIKSGLKILDPVSTDHIKGKDLRVEKFDCVSCKSTRIHYKVRSKVYCCSVSGYRLGSSRDEKVSIEDQDKMFDYYFISMYFKNDGYYTYSLYIFPTLLLMDINFFIFDEKKSNVHNSIQLRLEKSMSNQLWIDILNLNVYKNYKVVSITVKIPININLL